MATFKFNLGARVRDRMLGFEGFIDARTEYVNGCRRYAVQPKVGKDKKLPERQSFDEETLELLDEKLARQFMQPAGPGPG